MRSNDKKSKLQELVSKTIFKLEEEDAIVVCSVDNSYVVNKICDEAAGVLPKEDISTVELIGIRSLILAAISDKRFFDWEMPTLTGFSSEQFREIAEKLPKG